MVLAEYNLNALSDCISINSSDAPQSTRARINNSHFTLVFLGDPNYIITIGFDLLYLFIESNGCHLTCTVSRMLCVVDLSQLIRNEGLIARKFIVVDPMTTQRVNNFRYYDLRSQLMLKTRLGESVP